MQDTLYAERANGRVETWTYADGRRVFMWSVDSFAYAERLARRHGMRFVQVA
jgi:hypothetical protein